MKWKIRLQQTPPVLNMSESCCVVRPWSSSSVWQLLDETLEQVKEYIAGLQEYSEDGSFFQAFLIVIRCDDFQCFQVILSFLDARS